MSYQKHDHQNGKMLGWLLQHQDLLSQQSLGKNHKLASWRFEPSQPQRITAGLQLQKRCPKNRCREQLMQEEYITQGESFRNLL